VQGICCASEIPAIRNIVKPLPGVSKLNINLTTKIVHVQHNVSRIDATQIASALAGQGFPTQIQKDGARMAQAKQQATAYNGRSTLHVQGILQERDIETIRAALSSLNGVTGTQVNVSEAIIHVDHDLSKVSSNHCADHLKRQLPQFPCHVAVAAERAAGDAAAAALDSIGRSRYVESTFQFEGLQAYHIPQVEKAISRNFIRAQVRAMYPSVPSETVKVEHDPKLASADDICHTFRNFHTNGDLPLAKIGIDGADANLYLPLQEDYPENSVKHGDEPSLFQIHANVWLSGIFWVLSMFSYVDGKEIFQYFGLASVLFGLPPIAIKAWRTLRRKQFDANCMMVTAALGALALGEYDEAASVAFLFAISEFLEAKATLKARKALEEICALRPDHANVIHPITKEIVVVPADRVPLASLISVRTGDKIAADGIVVEGSSSVDESSLTGESQPVSKTIGDTISGGTINIGQTQLVVKTTSTVEDSAVSRLIRLVEEAQSNRSPTEKMIDSFARSYTPTVMVMASLMCTIPWAFGADIGRHWMLNGLIIIVIACPCALTISTPVTYAAGLAATAQRGIIIKGGSKLEAMGSVDCIVFDKTGTLTKGTFAVTHLEATAKSKTRQEMLQLLALMQARSSHPLSSSLVRAAKDEGVHVPCDMSVAEHQILKGEGITAKVDSTLQVYVGNQRLFKRLGMFETLSKEYKSLMAEWEETGGTIGFIGSQNDGIIGMFCVKDEVREEAKSVITELRKAQIETLICTGDSNSAAHAVANEIGIPSGNVNCQLLPEDKLHLVGSLKRPQPRSCGIWRQQRYVLFCGDGVNDAPALAVADIGVSMGEGAAMALEMSDITLMDSRLDKLTYSIHMGRRVLRTVKENITISLIAKSAVVGLTFLGKMTLLCAIASDVGVMLLVTLNGMKLLPTRSLMEVASLRRRKRRTQGYDFELVGGMATNGNTSDDDVEIV
jgi:Cd2+/Zn2+-exporting ATPase